MAGIGGRPRGFLAGGVVSVNVVIKLAEDAAESLDKLVKMYSAVSVAELLQAVASDLTLVQKRPGSWEGAKLREYLDSRYGEP